MVLGLAACLAPAAVDACTTAVISGRATADGRPLLWKNRDITAFKRNEVISSDRGRHRFVAVANVGSAADIWMGVNAAGLCLENSVSRDLDPDDTKQGIGNGGLIRLALETCGTVEEFRALLERTDATGRRTRGNFGAIDAHGAAALFEVGPRSFRMFDANDPATAPTGVIVRSNFATTPRDIPPAPAGGLVEGTYAGERYARACRLLADLPAKELTPAYLVRHVARDLADPGGEPIAGSVNRIAGLLPEAIDTSTTISRTTTVSAAVFHGVRPGEDPALTTMWVMLGDPKFSIAVPCWAAVEELAPALTGPHDAPLGAIAGTLREWNLTKDRKRVRTGQLRQIWDDVWPVEDRLLAEVAAARRNWAAAGAPAAELTALHRRLADEAVAAMRVELAQMKEAALTLPAPPPPAFAPFEPPVIIP